MVIKVIEEVINPGAGLRRSGDKKKDKELEVEDDYNNMQNEINDNIKPYEENHSEPL